uniref:Apple domain-containing protein n=1 Tax=Mesocestoides corti TaxID=53468 RepID=A0A5K3EM26_MESCO
MAMMIVTTVLLLCLERAVALWINYSDGGKVTPFDLCFSTCTNMSSTYDCGLYDSKMKICYCGTLQKGNTTNNPNANPD